MQRFRGLGKRTTKRSTDRPSTHRYKVTLSAFFFAPKDLNPEELGDLARVKILLAAHSAPLQCECVDGVE